TTTANGEYDFWVQVNKYGQTMNYISKYTASGSNVATVVYAGLQSKNTSGKFYITEMQEMTRGVCQNTNMWGTGVGDNARIYDYTGSGAALASTAATSATVNTGTFLLEDNRDQKTYLVRRLADGNCWMVQNLDLNLKNFAGTRKLTSANTDLNDKEYWDPSETLKNSQWVFNSTNITGGYANHLGIANILEPGPGYSTVGALSISQYQFQSRLNFGPNLFWGSRYQAGTIVDNTSGDNNNGLYINGNANVLYPRSYDNGFAYYDSNLFIDSDSGYKMIPVIPDAAGEVGKILQSSDYLTIDSEWQPELIMNQTGEKYTMRGNVYLGDYYNNYAAYAGNVSDGYTLEQNSICPKGWRLPSENIDEEKSWRKLLMDIYDIIEDDGDIIQFESIAKQFLLPISLGYTGQYNGIKGLLWDRSTYGYMYTSHNTLYMYRMNGKVSSSFPRPYMGNTLRCVARD
ncbi:hypothetical protein IKE71_03295, partial [Candidatus Saccharibacteria bacterium]|nr:hypothetical protein [Candidatus Saccharibacteria bacterium]